MIDTTKNTNRTSETQRRGVVGSFGDVVGDITSLAELQFELLKVDLAASSRKMLRGFAFAATAIMIVIGCIPIALFAVAALLMEFAGMTAASATGIALAIGLFFALVVALGAYAAIKSSTSFFERSQSELQRNISWLKGLKSRETRLNRSTFDTPNHPN